MATFHQALTLGGPTGTSPVLDPLAVLRLHNRLYCETTLSTYLSHQVVKFSILTTKNQGPNPLLPLSLAG